MQRGQTDAEIFYRISRVYKAIKREFNRRLESMDLTYVDFLVLMNLKDSQRSMVSLAKEILMTQAGITAAVDRLEEKGLVKRERDSQDRRVINVKITQEGLKVLNSALQIYTEMAEDILRDVKENDKAKLAELLDLLLYKMAEKKINF